MLTAMAVQRRLHQSFETPELRDMPLGPGESTRMHRYPGNDHIDDDSCWCSPITWTYEEVKFMGLREMQERMDRFLCVH